MSSVKSIDVNNEQAKQEEPTEQIEEVKEEVQEEVKEEEQPVIQNEVVEEPKEQPKAEPKEKLKNNSKTERYRDKMITCPRCSKSMLLRSYRYKHEKTCAGNIENRPIKPKAKPQPKAVPKPVPQPIYEEDEQEEQTQPQPVKFKLIKPEAKANTLLDFQNHYQLLQQQYMKQKQEKYNNLCSNMFKTKSKKR